MKSVTHPYTKDKPRLVEEITYAGVWLFNVERTAKYSRAGQAYTVREMFATVRPNVNALGLFDNINTGVVVLRNNFDEIREFPNFAAAKLYVHALFALEFAAG
jgi:hypothetical protein